MRVDRHEPGIRRGGGPDGAVVPGSLVLAASLAVCSTTTGIATASIVTKSTIPSSAFSDHTGITAKTVSVGNVSTLVAGLFKGAAVGQAYADYVNAHGGINGRKIAGGQQ